MFKRYRKSYVEINLKNIYENIKIVEDRLNEKKVIPVIKANAYGHGMIEVASYLYKKNIDYFAVSLLEEALELRSYIKDCNILVMGVVYEDQLLIASENNITVTLSSYELYEHILDFSLPLKVHLKIDTGMNRLGLKNFEEAQKIISSLIPKDNIYLEGIYTHFSTADCNKEYYLKQLRKFKDFMSLVNYQFPVIHISNSSSAIKYEGDISVTSHVRMGISMYGLTLDQETKFLKNTFRLITKVSQIKRLKKGEFLGYGATYQATEDTLIGVLPIGYGDGLIRKNTNGYVEINSSLYKIVGTICMGQTFIIIDDTVNQDQDVIIMGGMVSIDDVAKRLDTINYEVICQISNRVPREYIE